MMSCHSIRTSNLIADSKVECYVLPVKSINTLSEVDQNLKIRLLENIAKKLAKSLRQSNIEVAALNQWQ